MNLLKNQKFVIAIIVISSIFTIVMFSGFSVNVFACTSNDIALNIYQPLATCTQTNTITTVTTTTTFVSVNTPYSWGLWIAILLLIAVIVLFFLLKGKGKSE